FDSAYADIGPEGYYEAALLALYKEGDAEPDITSAVGFYQKAIDLGIQDAACYRNFAELLRKGGIAEGTEVHTPLKPDPVRAWDLIQKAIELDPIGPQNYLEAAGILILDSPKQDLDKAADLVAVAIALAGPRNTTVKGM